MISDTLNFVRAASISVLDLLVLPGHLILTELARIAPRFVSEFGISVDNNWLLYAVTCLFWLVVVLMIRAVLNLFRNLGIRCRRYKEAIVFRLGMEWRFFRQNLGRFSNLLSRNRQEEIVEPRHVDFDPVDISVLEAIASRGPGFAVSAPDIAEQMGMRPGEIQQHLDKLTLNSMLESVLGSTDGYENFRLTPSGESYVAMLQRKSAAPPKPRPEPQPAPASGEFIPDGIHLTG
jgi:DNA-binding MarR family transcriptional regulator